MSDSKININSVFKDSVRQNSSSIWWNKMSTDSSIYNSFIDNDNIDDPIITGFTISVDFNKSPLFYEEPLLDDINENFIDYDKAVSSKITTLLNNRYSKFKNNITESTHTNVGTISGKYNYDYYNPGYGAIDYLYMQDKYSSNEMGQNLSVESVSNNSVQNVTYDNLVSAIDKKIESLRIQLNDANLRKELLKNAINKNDEMTNDSQINSDSSEPDSISNSILNKKAKTQTNELTQCKGNGAQLSQQYDECNGNINNINSQIAELERQKINAKSQLNESTNIAETNNQNDYNFQQSKDYAPLSVMNMLRFNKGFKKLVEKTPYVFQSVEGLESVYSEYFNIENPLRNSGDNIITVNCLESIDLKVSGLFNRYLNATYDRKYKRERVPQNLRKFDMSIFVHDIRNYRSIHSMTGLAMNDLYYNASNFSNKSVVSTTGNSELSAELIKKLANHLSVVEFKFFKCEFIPKETGNIFNSVSNIGSDQVSTKFAFSFEDCVVNMIPHEDIVKLFGIYKDKTEYDLAFSNETSHEIYENVYENEVKSGQVTRALNSLVGYALRSVSNNQRSIYGTIEQNIKHPKIPNINGNENVFK